MKKENNIILCGIAIAVLASAGFAMSQGTISSAMILHFLMVSK